MRKKRRALLQMAIWTGVVCLGASLHAQVPASAPRLPETSMQAPAEAETERVVAIRIVDEKGQVLQENPAQLPQQTGQPLDFDAVRESLRQLYRTGRYADLRAETTPVAGGVRLDFVVRRNFFVNLVRVVGLTAHPGKLAALASLNLSLGEPFRESGLKEALGRLTQTLRDEGLYQAQLAYELAPHEDTRQMDITVRVAPGPRARVGSITLRNHTELPDAELLGRSKLRPGKEVTSTQLNHASERMRQLLVHRDHLGARVNLHRGEYDGKSNTLPLEIEVIAGPKVRVEVVGAKIPAKELRKRLPIYQEGAVDEDLLQEGRRAIRDYLEREGYAAVQVQYTTSEAPAKGEGRGTAAAEHVITYRIERGPRYRLVGIAFDGNKYFSDDLLLSRLRLQPAGFASRGRFSVPMMQDDAASIRDLYVSSGFSEATVRPEVDNNYQGRKNNFFVRFHIDEGLQTRVAELKLQGNHALSDSKLLAVIGSTAGQPYSDFNVASDRDNILALYYNDGFPEARFSAEVEEVPGLAEAAAGKHAPGFEDPAQPLVEYKRVRLVYHIVEGPQISVARVLIGGYEHTLPHVVEREVEIKPEGPLREGDVVETQRRLYNLGIFSRVSIAPQNPNGTDTDKTVVVLVEEAHRYTIAYGGGFEVQRLGSTSDPTGGELSASPRGILEASKANLTGRADTLSFRARASTLQWRGLMSYTTPNAFGRPELSVQLTALADRSRDILTFVSTRYEGSFQIAQRVSLVTSLLYRYSFRRVLASSLQSTLSLDQIPLFNQPTRVSLFGGTWVRERRDNPADATHGDFNTLDFSVAGRPIGSSATFSRLLFQDSTYHRLSRRFTFARSTRFGFEQPFGASTATSIPLPERFFAGGGLSLRGFGLNQAGPRDPGTGFPVGGLAMLIFNQELRFPMRLPFVGSRLGGAVFYDAGNVFQNVRRITFRTSPPSAGDLNYFSHTIGFSFRYATPIGPVRVDLAYQLNAPLFFLPGGDALCPTGNPATPTAACQRLPRFQFFFNLGQIF